MRSIRERADWTDVPVLVRAALNVPVNAAGEAANTFRLRRAMPTIEYLRARRARVILIGHLGEKGTETFAPVYEALRPLVSGIRFCPATIGPEARKAARELPAGEVLLLENLRRDKGETANSPSFAAALAELGDAFVEDAFDVCHRPHASVIGLPSLLPSYAGLLVEEEVRELSKALAPSSPSLAIVGGAKFGTKEPVLQKLLGAYDRVFVGGALANDFVRASGKKVGASIVSPDTDQRALKELLANRKLMLPLDVVVAPPNAMHDAGHAVRIDEVPDGEAMYDEGPATVEHLARLAGQAKTILWNGPLGFYEHGFTDATRDLARAIASSGAHSILGGGDTVAAVEALGLAARFSFISTGGGAMLDFLAKGTLPGLDALG